MATTFDPSMSTVAGRAENSADAIAVPITLRINGKEHSLRIDPRTTLLDCIRLDGYTLVGKRSIRRS